jgi:hypothetical protein
MATVSLSGRSYLKFAQLLESNGVVFWDLPEFPEIPQRTDDTTISVDDQTELRLDNLAYQAYGDSELWWVIAVANDLQLIPTEIKRGMTLRVPSQEYVFKELLR